MSCDNAVFNFFLYLQLSFRSIRSFPFSGRRDRTSEPEVSKIWGEFGRGGREGEGGGEKRNGLWSIQSQQFCPTPFAHEREAIVQFNWLLARQSKSDIRNLTFMPKPTSETRQDQNTYARVRGSVRIFCSGNVGRSFANGNHIDL